MLSSERRCQALTGAFFIGAEFTMWVREIPVREETQGDAMHPPETPL